MTLLYALSAAANAAAASAAEAASAAATASAGMMVAARGVTASTGRMEQGEAGDVAVGDEKGVVHAMVVEGRRGIEVEDGCVEKVMVTTTGW